MANTTNDVMSEFPLIARIEAAKQRQAERINEAKRKHRKNIPGQIDPFADEIERQNRTPHS